MNTIEVNNNKISSNTKIIIKDNIINLSNIDINIIYRDSNISLNINIDKDVKLFEYHNNSITNNIYNLTKNSNLILNRFSIKSNLTTDLNLYESSNCLYKYSCININDSNYIININHLEKNSISKIINNGLNMNNSKLNFIINSKILKSSINVDTNQDSKIILMGENNCLIKPNLLVDNNNINANHSAYIGHFKEQEVFYLKSRGIKENEVFRLLAKAFLIGNMNIDFLCKNMILQDLNNYWR